MPSSSATTATTTFSNNINSTDTDPESWLPDTAVLYRSLIALARKEVSTAQLFDEFGRLCSFPSLSLAAVSSPAPTLSSSSAVSRTSKRRKITSHDEMSKDKDRDGEREREKNLADDEVRLLQCRFFLALNDLQRLGCVRLLASGDRLKRLLM